MMEDIPDLLALCFELTPHFDLITMCKLFEHCIIVLHIVTSYMPHLQVN